MTNNFSYTGTTNGSANTATSYALTPRWNYLAITNQAASNTAGAGAGIIFVRTDGSAAVTTGNDDLSICIMAGATVVVANMLPLWSQAALVIPNGTSDINGTEIYGGTANPGVSVSILSPGTSVPFTIAAAG